ncbi:unnamed protein product [Spirodela intermedia]|uniref:H/ACA ribonucleoprotein complex non-core subunit NAF1 n=1 Tax=Spirodela intermedia TaxID=51605 RepID=A0A7I8JFU2_SPIIN|nr:unnamed protein product [Spirodela intermedia]CAA6668801.1 unnamed protein product [Spirodela intermedia]
MSSDDDVATKGPIKSKNELEVSQRHLIVEGSPPVLPVNATLEPHHQTHSVGAISSIVDNRVIVEGVAEHNPLNEGSILWVTETRSPLGTVDEIFGPVKNPYYIVRYNSEEEIPAGICEGTAISFASEFAGHILNDPSLYKKGYDASGENDEEVDEEVEFSDDEREAEYRRSLRQTKRGTDGSRQRNSEPFDKKKAQFDKRRIQDRGSGYMNSWKEERLPVPGESSSPRGPMQHRSRPQRPFIRGQSQRSPHRPSQAPTSPHPPCVPVHSQSSNQVQGQMQAPPPLQPFAHGQPLQVPTLPPYVMGQLQMPMLAAPCNPGPPAHAGAVNVPHAYFQGPHSVPGIPYGGQSGGPLGQNFFMQQPNPFWPLGAPSQQFITAFPGMLPANGMQGQQIQGHPYPQNQNQAFPGFANGPTFQFAFSPNQGLPPGMPWQGCGPPYPSAAMLSAEPAPRDGVSQTVPPGPIGGGEQGPASLSNGNQTAGAPPMKFNMGRHLGRGKRPFSRGGGGSGGRGRGRGGG